MKRRSLTTVAATAALLATAALASAADYSTTPRDDSVSHSDMQITENVKGKLAVDEPAVAPAIVVTTRDGVVTLKGIALTNDYITRALFDARTVDGVVQVKNELSLQ